MNDRHATVYVTKWALSKGIQKWENARISGGYNYAFTTSSGFGVHRRDWHLIEEAANAKAEEMRVKKIASLKKQIEKLEKLSFK